MNNIQLIKEDINKKYGHYFDIKNNEYVKKKLDQYGNYFLDWFLIPENKKNKELNQVSTEIDINPIFFNHIINYDKDFVLWILDNTYNAKVCNHIINNLNKQIIDDDFLIKLYEHICYFSEVEKLDNLHYLSKLENFLYKFKDKVTIKTIEKFTENNNGLFFKFDFIKDSLISDISITNAINNSYEEFKYFYKNRSYLLKKEHYFLAIEKYASLINFVDNDLEFYEELIENFLTEWHPEKLYILDKKYQTEKKWMNVLKTYPNQIKNIKFYNENIMIYIISKNPLYIFTIPEYLLFNKKNNFNKIIKFYAHNILNSLKFISKTDRYNLSISILNIFLVLNIIYVYKKINLNEINKMGYFNEENLIKLYKSDIINEENIDFYVKLLKTFV